MTWADDTTTAEMRAVLAIDIDCPLPGCGAKRNQPCVWRRQPDGTTEGNRDLHRARKRAAAKLRNRMLRPDAVQVLCPVCSQQAGRACVSSDGEPLGWVHQERQYTYEVS